MVDLAKEYLQIFCFQIFFSQTLYSLLYLTLPLSFPFGFLLSRDN